MELVGALAVLRPLTGGAVSWPGIGRSHPTPHAIRAGGTAYIPEDRQRDGLVLSFSIADNLVLCAYDAAPFARWGQRDQAAIAAHARALMAAFDVRAPSERTPVMR